MDTRTGEIFGPQIVQEVYRPVTVDGIGPVDDRGRFPEITVRRTPTPLDLDLEKLRRAREAHARGELVEVSEQVAQTMKLGQRELERRRRRRKAQRAARRQNR